jgi:putative ABC transport system permease protein
MGAPTFGVSWNADSTPLTIRQGRAPAGRDEVAVDAGTAQRYGLEVGEEIEILFIGQPRTFTIVGVMGFGDADTLAGATMAVFDLTTAQEVFDRVSEFDALQVIGEEGVTPQELRVRIAEALPEGYEAVTGTDVAAQDSA